jgi:hypothetical protein
VTVNRSYTAIAHWILSLGWLLVALGCEPLYQSYTFTEPLHTTFPVQVTGEDVWITSIPVGAEVYVQPYDPEHVPSHATTSEAYRGQTPIGFMLPPGSYWIELVLDAQVFENYFSPPFDQAQFEQDGAFAEALLFRPFAPGDKRRLLRYYHLVKQPQQGQTLIALFHPRGEPLERVAALYPQQEHYQFVPNELRELLQQAQIPPTVQDAFLTLMRRGGKVFWSMRDEYRVALELQPDAVQGRVVVLYTGTPLPDPLIPDR